MNIAAIREHENLINFKLDQLEEQLNQVNESEEEDDFNHHEDHYDDDDNNPNDEDNNDDLLDDEEKAKKDLSLENDDGVPIKIDLSIDRYMRVRFPMNKYIYSTTQTPFTCSASNGRCAAVSYASLTGGKKNIHCDMVL